MAGSWITVGQLASASDVSAAQLVSLDGTQTAAAVDARVAPAAQQAAAEFLATDPGVATAAAEAAVPAVADAIAGADLITGSDERIFLDESLPGWRMAMHDGENISFGIRSNGDTFARLGSDTVIPRRLPTDPINLYDLTHEWWTAPVFTRIGRTTYGGGVSSVGEICVWDKTARNQPVVTFMGMSKVDDHCAPSRFVEAGRRQLVTWNWHGDTTGLQYRVSSVDGTSWLPEQFLDIGLSASYDQMEKITHLSDASQDTIYHLIRRGSTAWGIQPTSLDQATGALTKGAWIPLTSSVPDMQSYLIKRSLIIGGQQHWDIFWYPNPSEATSEVHAFRVNLVTGAITSPVDGALTANLNGTNLPLLKSSMAPMFTNLTGTGDRRIFYPSPLNEWKLLVAEWDTTTPATGRYLERKWLGGVVTSTDLGVTGPPVGYTKEANYVGGSSYSPSGASIATCELLPAGGSVVYVTTAGVRREVARYSWSAIRPMWVSENEIIVGHVERYGADYYDFKIHDGSIFV